MCFAHTPVSRQEAHEEHVEMQMERYPDMTEAEKVMEDGSGYRTKLTKREKEVSL